MAATTKIIEITSFRVSAFTAKAMAAPINAPGLWNPINISFELCARRLYAPNQQQCRHPTQSQHHHYDYNIITRIKLVHQTMIIDLNICFVVDVTLEILVLMLPPLQSEIESFAHFLPH
eukprot:m.84264 g.84264  ORF g.84264 m.84264 type:complete len:119 (+) comp12959_c0_seq3:1499-1855(+)